MIISEAYIDRKSSKKDTEQSDSKSGERPHVEAPGVTKKIQKKTASSAKKGIHHVQVSTELIKPSGHDTNQSTPNQMAIQEEPVTQDLDKSNEFELPAKDLNFSVITENANNNAEELYQQEPQTDEQFKKALTSFNNQGNGNNIELWSVHDSQNDRPRDRNESDKENDDVKWLDLSDYNPQNFLSQYEVPSMNLNRAYPSNIFSQTFGQPFNQSESDIKNFYRQASKENIMQNPNPQQSSLQLDKFNSNLLQNSGPPKLGRSLSREAPELLPVSSLESDDKQPIHHSNSCQLNTKLPDTAPHVIARSHSNTPSVSDRATSKQE